MQIEAIECYAAGLFFHLASMAKAELGTIITTMPGHGEQKLFLRGHDYNHT